MAILVDTSAVIAVAANERVKPKLIDLTRGEELLAASTLPWEIGNAISAMFKQRRISLDEGLELVRQFRLITVQIVEASLEKSVQLASDLNIYAYDAYVLQCALDNNVPILTLDSGLKDAARRVGVPVLEPKP
jgi:predicted nucleic acid-binding protein